MNGTGFINGVHTSAICFSQPAKVCVDYITKNLDLVNIGLT